MESLEIIPHQYVDGMRIFINKVEYRSPHFHPEWELLWVLDSPLAVTSSQKQHLIQPGELILFPPNYPHEFHKMDNSCTFLCLQISSEICPAVANLSTEGIRLADFLPPEDDRWLRQAVVDTARSCWNHESFSQLFCQGLCALILHRLLKFVPSHIMSAEETASMEQRNARLMRLMKFVDDNYMHKIRLSDFAEQEGLTVSYMSHFVRDMMNQTFQDYVNMVRFNCARKLMSTGTESMTSICMESGFSDYRYFSRTFQKTYGITPAEYRRQAPVTLPDSTAVTHSLHSVEEILSEKRCLEMLDAFQAQLHSSP